MATSLFFMPADQKSGEIRTEPPQKSNRGRKPGSRTTGGQQNQKKQKLRGMGVAQLEQHIRAEEEKKMLAANPKEPVVVLQGFPSYAGGLGGGSGHHQIMIDPVWSFVETSSTTHHELSSIPNHPPPQISINRCDTCCFKKKRLDGDHQNAARSNGGGFSKHTMMNGYDQRSHGFFYDHRLARSINPYFNEATNHTGSLEGFGSGNPRNGSSGGHVKEYYEFFPEKYDDFPEKTDSSVATSLGHASSATIDLSLKL